MREPDTYTANDLFSGERTGYIHGQRSFLGCENWILIRPTIYSRVRILNTYTTERSILRREYWIHTRPTIYSRVRELDTYKANDLFSVQNTEYLHDRSIYSRIAQLIMGATLSDGDATDATEPVCTVSDGRYAPAQSHSSALRLRAGPEKVDNLKRPCYE
ncbi:hypothetical protein J6590_055526 [Homalodisca vitripennis]|nr:hypothetical protein J6590_055526 [Homalodisca vitripennis]